MAVLLPDDYAVIVGIAGHHAPSCLCFRGKSSEPPTMAPRGLIGNAVFYQTRPIFVTPPDLGRFATTEFPNGIGSSRVLKN
jgi:hypothetical protein